MRRRDFIKLIVSSTVVWPFAARAQQPDRVGSIGVLIALPQSDPEAKAWVGGLLQGLQKRGWSEGRNLHIDYRYALPGAQVQVLAKELVALQPDVIFAMPTPAVAALHEATREIPIVFAALADPIGSGFIASLPRPGGNITGVMQYEPSITGKWLAAGTSRRARRRTKSVDRLMITSDFLPALRSTDSLVANAPKRQSADSISCLC